MPCRAAGDVEALAASLFLEEGAFLLKAEILSDRLTARLNKGPRELDYEEFPRTEIEEAAGAFARIVGIAREYHLGAAECGR